MYQLFFGLTSLIMLLSSCYKESQEASDTNRLNIVVFLPGKIQGSPALTSLMKSIHSFEAEKESNFSFSVIEAGFNQAEWDIRFKKIVVTTQADLYVTTNPSMLPIVNEMAQTHPSKKFLIFESPSSQQKNVITIDFKAEELAFLSGVYTSAYFRKEYPDLVPYVAILVGQEYPRMDQIISAYKKGFESLGYPTRVSYRVLGNWYDAERARQIASQFFQAGAMGVFSIAGVANQGVFQAAKEDEGFIMFYEMDSSETFLQDKSVLFSGFINYASLFSQFLKEFSHHTLSFGQHYEYGIKDKVLGFIDNNSFLKQNLKIVENELKLAKKNL